MLPTLNDFNGYRDPKRVLLDKVYICEFSYRVLQVFWEAI